MVGKFALSAVRGFVIIAIIALIKGAVASMKAQDESMKAQDELEHRTFKIKKYENIIAPTTLILGILGFVACYVAFGVIVAVFEFVAVILALIFLLIADKVLSDKNAREYKEQQEKAAKQKREEERKKQEEQIAKEEEERKRQENLETTKTYLYVHCRARVEDILKDKRATSWIVENIIGGIIDDLGYKSLLKAKDSVTLGNSIILGPYTLDRAQVFSWKNQYDHFQHQKVAENNRLRVQAQQKIERKNQAWQTYIERFKKLNYAQQQSELDWFKKKIVSKMTPDKDKQEEYIHQLEIINLGKKPNQYNLG